MEQEVPSVQLDKQKLIIITGFGPFIGHEDVNASWEAVKLLPDILTYRNETYILEKQMIAVEYNAVDEAVKAIWQREPELVIHCGVNGNISEIHVEKLAYNHKFVRADYAGNYLRNGTACVERENGQCVKVLHCGLNLNQLVESVSSKINDKSCTLAISKNVGGYLCGYIYLKSLHMDCERSLFIHVPPVDKPLSSVQTADVIFKIAEECIRQLNECSKSVEKSSK